MDIKWAIAVVDFIQAHVKAELEYLPTAWQEYYDEWKQNNPDEDADTEDDIDEQDDTVDAEQTELALA
jgi:hypothetical protein